MGYERSPATLAHEQTLAGLEDGGLCRMRPPHPGVTGGRTGLYDGTSGDRLLEAMRRAAPLLPALTRQEFTSLYNTENMALTLGVLTMWAGSHFFGIGEVIDLLFMLGAGMFLGRAALHAADDLVAFVRLASRARSETDLDQAAAHLARFVAAAGVASFSSLLYKAAGQLRNLRLSGRPTGGQPSSKWWEATDFGSDWPGTSVPQSFTLRIGDREFFIKPNATKHLADYAKGHASMGSQMTQTDFPLSSLAGALESMDLQGRLLPLMNKQAERIGSKQSPMRIGEWELSVELVNGKLEVLHANYRP